VITTAGKLPCKAVIHTVGPRTGEGDEDNKMLRAVLAFLDFLRINVQRYL
jgi:O-acetyl-ADP-ribose deacetylase (regulator of RNase III)